jgi:hypothetical protein
MHAMRLEDLEKDGTTRDERVEDPDDDDGRKSESRCDLAVLLDEGSVRRCSRVLGASLGVDVRARDGEEQELGGHREVEGLGEVLGLLHVSYERRDESLADPGVSSDPCASVCDQEGVKGARTYVILRTALRIWTNVVPSGAQVVIVGNPVATSNPFGVPGFVHPSVTAPPSQSRLLTLD